MTRYVEISAIIKLFFFSAILATNQQLRYTYLTLPVPLTLLFAVP